MNRIQELAALKAALDEVNAWGDGYVSDHVAAAMGLPIGVLGARVPTEWNVVLIADQMEGECNMDRAQELAAIRAAMVELDAEKDEYSISDIAHLSDVPIGKVSEYVYYVGCRTELGKLRNRRSLVGYWELDDVTN